MNTHTRGHTATRLGRSFGRGWRACARVERRVCEWLASKGVPRAGAAMLLWMVKLAALGLLVYVGFWLAVVLLGAVLIGLAMNRHRPDEAEFELQYPTIEELRTTPGYDPNLYNDTSHEMYQDD